MRSPVYRSWPLRAISLGNAVVAVILADGNFLVLDNIYGMHFSKMLVYILSSI